SSLVTGNLNLNITITGYLYIIILAFLSLAGMIGFKKGLELINTVTAAILSTFEPVTSLIVGVLLLEEILLVHQIIGSLLIIFAVVFVALIEKKEKTMVKSEVDGKVK
ncbi:MAG: EamA family transporter, partial [Bacillota bacterium]|nr:EamA family transporter [Bacillota bacterium]